MLRNAVALDHEWKKIPALWRWQHWTKNLLIFLPVALTPDLIDADGVRALIFCAAAFSFLASAGYVVNDYCDREADEAVYSESTRAQLGGGVTGLLTTVALLSALCFGFGLATLLPPNAQAVLYAYFALSCLYSLSLRSYPLLDLLLVALFHAFRPMSGFLAAGTPVDFGWANEVALICLALVCLKRSVELHVSPASALSMGRPYRPTHSQLLFRTAVAFSALSVLLAAYLVFSRVAEFSAAALLQIAVPASLAYWLHRTFLVARRAEPQKEFLSLVLQRRETYLCAAAILTALWAAST